MAEKRIYVVKEDTGVGVKENLVSANSQAQAVSFVVKARFTAAAAGAHDVARLMAAGAKVQEAGATDE